MPKISRRTRPPSAFGQALEKLEKEQPDQVPSLRQQVKDHLPAIEKLLAQGHSFNRIAAALQAEGMQISVHTLRQYTQALRRGGVVAPGLISEVKRQPQRRTIPGEASIPLNTMAAPEMPAARRPTFKAPLPGDEEL